MLPVLLLYCSNFVFSPSPLRTTTLLIVAKPQQAAPAFEFNKLMMPKIRTPAFTGAPLLSSSAIRRLGFCSTLCNEGRQGWGCGKLVVATRHAALASP